MRTKKRSFLLFLHDLCISITEANVNTACWYITSQDQLPKNSKKLRKF